MQFDLRTLFVVLVVLSSCMGFVCLFLPYRRAGSDAVTNWGYALLALAAGSAGIALRGMIPDFFSIILANVLVLLAYLFVLRSVDRARGRAAELFAWAVIGIALLLFAYFTYSRPDTQMRIIVSCVAVTLLVVRPVIALTFAAKAGCRRARLFTAACIAGVGLVMLVRAILTAEWGSGTDFLAADSIQFSAHLLFAVFAALATLGVAWIEIEQLQAELERQAMIDQLTGTLNRRAFMIEYERELSRCTRDKSGLALAIFDLDHFKAVNDRFGHLVGDQALRTVAEKLRASLRAHDILGRYGGEEFALLLPGADRNTAEVVAERARLAVSARPIEAGGFSIPLTVSAGVASYGVNGTDWETLLQSADMALYEAKRDGRNQVISAS
jgi:diguanylate cyclase (GGDEF)-like protein